MEALFWVTAPPTEVGGAVTTKYSTVQYYYTYYTYYTRYTCYTFYTWLDRGFCHQHKRLVFQV